MSTNRPAARDDRGPDASAGRGAWRPNDDGRYVEPRLLESLEAFVARCRTRSEPSNCSPAELHRIGQFLHFEAQLLDARRYREWFELLSEDFAYWVPSTYGKASLHDDVAVNFDDRRRILDRIAYTTSGVQMAQTPPSRTLRSLTNISAWRQEPGAGAEPPGFDVAAGLVVWAHRRGQTTTFAGHLRTMLAARGDSFAIRARVIELLDADEPQGNNSFIL